MSTSMAYYDWWKKVVVFPVRHLCRSLAIHLGFRKSGLLMLSREVEACEYEDVRIMWDMLNKTETTSHQHQFSRSSKLLKISRPNVQLNVFRWTRSCFMP